MTKTITQKLVSLVIALVCMLNISLHASNGDKVYVTESGKKFHKRNCSAATGKTGIDKAQAIKDGYTACSKCFDTKDEAKDAKKETKKDEKKDKKDAPKKEVKKDDKKKTEKKEATKKAA
ncbi:MAG: hypothetical protein ABL940_05520 [Bacteroidia bacterium]